MVRLGIRTGGGAEAGGQSSHKSFFCQNDYIDTSIAIMTLINYGEFIITPSLSLRSDSISKFSSPFSLLPSLCTPSPLQIQTRHDLGPTFSDRLRATFALLLRARIGKSSGGRGVAGAYEWRVRDRPLLRV